MLQLALRAFPSTASVALFPYRGSPRLYPVSDTEILVSIPFEVEQVHRVRPRRCPSSRYSSFSVVPPSAYTHFIYLPTPRRSQLKLFPRPNIRDLLARARARSLKSDVRSHPLELFSSMPTLDESEWPPYTKDHPQYFIWNAEKSGFGRGPRTTDCAFWNKFLPQLKRVPGT